MSDSAVGGGGGGVRGLLQMWKCKYIDVEIDVSCILCEKM